MTDAHVKVTGLLSLSRSLGGVRDGVRRIQRGQSVDGCPDPMRPAAQRVVALLTSLSRAQREAQRGGIRLFRS